MFHSNITLLNPRGGKGQIFRYNYYVKDNKQARLFKNNFMLLND